MKFEEFKILHNRFSNFPLSRKETDSEDYEQYIEALNSNKELYEWTLKKKFEEAEFEYKTYCCMQMADSVYDSLNEKGEIKYDDVDVVMNKWNDGTYGIPIHDGGTSVIVINFCPWCGEKLKK